MLSDTTSNQGKTNMGKEAPTRLGYRIGEWSRMTGTSRVTTWRAIRHGQLKVIDYLGIPLIPASEAVRLGLAAAKKDDKRS
jgi:hypothetical protein